MREKFRELVKRKNRIHANLELIQWDLETKTPLKSRPYLSDWWRIKYARLCSYLLQMNL